MFDLECGIRLRAAHTSPGTDYDNIVALYNNAKVAEYMSYDFPVPQGDSLKEFFQGIVTKNAEMFCIVETIPQSQGGNDNVGKPRFVGMAALWVSRRERGHRHSEFGIGLMPEFWGKGYGKEITKFLIHHGFYHLNLHRISLETIGGNDRAITMYKTCGFVEEGRLREAVWVRRGWRDIIVMGILVDEWRERSLNRD